jgi:predicted nucleic acid-binding protein
VFLLDTNVVSELPRPKPDPHVLSWLAAHPDGALSAVSVEELAYGVAKLPEGRRERLERWLEELLAIPGLVIPIDTPIARLAGQLRATRDRRGRRVAQADMIIAATALVTGRTLVTRNTKHFEGCGVALLNPFLGPPSLTSAAPPPRPRRA